ncbi:MAPEG family protein [Maritimibacter dapengensis]|uniref:MAPEG family protein n=1 Tax=Maritimibacter dapengensis TaxID=2836868 RepID=A0ABS6SYV6_9RHOB|nr:MAPEG family protein [Maritimibacter dapengensis]MBV7377718.1 MAPEG family protein [Maritimibacter dapengensis]
MTPELTALALAGLLHIVGFSAYSVMANVDVGTGYTTSPRDRAPSRELRQVTARLGRAYDNSAAMIGLFAGGCLLVVVAGADNLFTAIFAYLYVALRALYIFAYARGWRPWRSFIWLGALTCCALLYLTALIFGMAA